MRDWITVNGRKLIWEDFISILDSYSYRAVVRAKGRHVCDQYNYMVCALQELTFDYHQGSDCIPERREDFIRRHCLEMPEERRLPEALEELFNQMQEILHVNLSEMLDECAINSTKTHRRMQEAQRRERERMERIKSLPVRGDIESGDAIEKVCYLLNLQREKMRCPDYRVGQQETAAVSMWCELLIASLSVDTVTNGLMKRAVENDILSEGEITALLREKCRIEKDYEWYSEDLLGCILDEPTDIRIRDFLPLCERRFREILGISRSF